MEIREAEPRDAEAMSRVLIASITELCDQDHGGEPANIESWTANKAPDTVRTWIDDPAHHLVVAERAGLVVGVGCYGDDGEVRLNYVAPEARLSGVSKALLSHMEQAMRARGITVARLSSTCTARRFYRSAGWVDNGPAEPRFGVACHPMTKALGAAEGEANA
ncbi:GNAT family N-acetyltransferase [Bauldia sp.]|uniref:GNAT family N-acetyltransferase n=1 Tax=Bauldia sp. TaxID=2575872 RepID=UPI003BAAEA20